MDKTYDRFITCSSHHFISRCNERGYTTLETEDCIVKKVGSLWTIDTQHPKYPSSMKKNLSTDKGGAGTELKSLLKLIGITSSPGCSCNKRAAIMDHNGIDWCKQNLDQIVSWLREEATKRKLPFANFAGKKIVRMAISRAEKAAKKAGTTQKS